MPKRPNDAHQQMAWYIGYMQGRQTGFQVATPSPFFSQGKKHARDELCRNPAHQGREQGIQIAGDRRYAQDHAQHNDQGHRHWIGQQAEQIPAPLLL